MVGWTPFYGKLRAESMMQKQWLIAPAAPAEQLALYHAFSPILAQALYNRGFEEPAAAQEFLHSQALDEDPFTMKDMAIAVERISRAIAAGQPMAVYGDFDADGVCATVLLVEVLTALGAQVEPYIPNRAEEGYGLNIKALQTLAAKGIELVITVDCGIRSVAEVEAVSRAGRKNESDRVSAIAIVADTSAKITDTRAKIPDTSAKIVNANAKLDIIVTDHHSIGPDLPRALAIINPQQTDCPGEAGLAGVGVAFMLAKALLLQRWRSDRANYPTLRLSDLLDLVALGTVADVVGLNVSLNRRLVRHGLNTINELRRPGIKALAQVAGLQAGSIRASNIGFGLGPRINAAGRLGSAMLAYDLLAAKTVDEAEPLALELHALNTRRRQQTGQALAAIREQVGEAEELALIFAGDENIPVGITGLIAGKLVEQFYRPAVVLEIGVEQSRASCRSIPEFNITSALDECADLLLRHGGHAMAAGFTVRNSNLDMLRQALEQKARTTLAGKELKPQLKIDCEIALADLSEELLAELDLLEPTGHKNPAPILMSRGLQLRSCRRVGAEKQHLKLRLWQNGSPPVDAIGFGLGAWAKRMPERIDAAYQVEINEWGGRRSLQMRLLDIRPSKQENPADRLTTEKTLASA